ncbi:hypothetical protein LINGRAHAP2_LOCUS7440, partial [Linum grandiflorum]
TSTPAAPPPPPTPPPLPPPPPPPSPPSPSANAASDLSLVKDCNFSVPRTSKFLIISGVRYV